MDKRPLTASALEAKLKHRRLLNHLWEEPMTKPITVSDSDFSDKVLESQSPVMVDFWATWCMPCKLVHPIIDELAREYDGKVTFARLDVDANPNSSRQYGVRSIPTLILFSGGKPMDQIIGAMPKSALKGRIDAFLKKT
jgi:thioredoxin 1